MLPPLVAGCALGLRSFFRRLRGFMMRGRHISADEEDPVDAVEDVDEDIAEPDAATADCVLLVLSVGSRDAAASYDFITPAV